MAAKTNSAKRKPAETYGRMAVVSGTDGKEVRERTVKNLSRGLQIKLRDIFESLPKGRSVQLEVRLDVFTE